VVVAPADPDDVRRLLAEYDFGESDTKEIIYQLFGGDLVRSDQPAKDEFVRQKIAAHIKTMESPIGSGSDSGGSDESEADDNSAPAAEPAPLSVSEGGLPPVNGPLTSAQLGTLPVDTNTVGAMLPPASSRPTERHNPASAAARVLRGELVAAPVDLYGPVEGFHLPDAKRAKTQDSTVVVRTGYLQTFFSALGSDFGVIPIADQIQLHAYMKREKTDQARTEAEQKVADDVAERARQEDIKAAERVRKVADDVAERARQEDIKAAERARKVADDVAERARQEDIKVAADRHQKVIAQLENERNESNARAEASRYSISAAQIDAGARARFMQEHPELAVGLFNQRNTRVAPAKLLTDILKLSYVSQRPAPDYRTPLVEQLCLLRADLTVDEITKLHFRLVALCNAKLSVLLPYSVQALGRGHATYGQVIYATTLPDNIAKSILDWALSTQDASGFSVGAEPTSPRPAIIDWEVRRKHKRLTALVVKLKVPVEQRDDTNTRLVLHLAKNEDVTICGEPQVVYIKESAFDDDFPPGFQRALLAENPTQAMADLNPFRATGDVHRRIAIELRTKLPILNNWVTEGEWAAALGAGGGLSEKFLTMDARPGHWGGPGATGSSEFVPLAEWLKYVFVGAGIKHFNNLVNTVMNASVNDLTIQRNEDQKPTRYRISDYENIGKVYSVCHTINRLQPDLREKIKTKFGYAK
jgi:hypothetical protein